MPTPDHRGAPRKCLKKRWRAKDKPMEQKSETANRAELQSSEVGALVLRLFEISRELRGDHTTTLHDLAVLEDTTTGD